MENNHSLLLEFPEHSEKIHKLKVSDNHFRKLFDEYHKLDHQVHRIEVEAEPTTDEYLNRLRISRVKLKDELYGIITGK